MNKAIRLFFIFFAVCFSTVHAQDSFEDLKAINQVINDYFDGATNANIAGLEKAFHKVCVLRWVIDGHLMESPRDEWFAWIKANGPFERENAIEKIDITGSAAMVKAVADLKHTRFVDYISLLKINGDWKIVAKIFLRVDK